MEGKSRRAGSKVKVTVLINDKKIHAFDYKEELFVDPKSKKERRMSKFSFDVTSATYHEITTLLYTNDFHIEVPENNLKMNAEIATYSTSITNLYDENQVGEFYLELIEQN